MKIARHGWKMIGVALIAAGVGFAVGPMGWPVGAFALGYALFAAYFFRDPERVCPADPDKIYAPGDGRVLSIAREGSDDTVTVRIFLSVFNVHLQRNACSGVVESVEYIKGAFAMAMKPASYTNERSIVRIQPDGGRGVLAVEQIAGFVARRIETWVKPGERLKAGERYGIIYFGSQVAVHFPKGSKPVVAVGDRVAGGETVIGEWTA